MLFDKKEQAEKEAYKSNCESAHQMCDKWNPCRMHKHTHKKMDIMPIYFDQLLIDKKKSI